MPNTNDRYVIRPGRADDVAELARLHAAVQLQAVTGGKPHPGIAAWVEDLLDGHPTVVPEDFLVAEETATGRPAASLVGLRQQWTLAGVRLPVAQVELVGTAPEHRGNRLTDRLFAALHERYAAGGVPIQMIEGLPYFYRRLGYDYALANDGAPTLPVAPLLPVGPDGPDRPAGAPGLTVRPATVADAEALTAIDRRIADNGVLFCPRDATMWRYEITGRRRASIARRVVAVLVRGADVAGYLVYGSRLSATGELAVFAAACDRPVDWPRAAEAMRAHLLHTGRKYEAAAGEPFRAVRPILGPDHPLVRLSPAGVPRRARGWYVRTGDPAQLLTLLQPLLRARWHAAGLRWPEPTLTIDTYGRAARLTFDGGELAGVTGLRGAVSPSTDPETHAAIPPGALLQLALGHRDLPDVLDIWPDCLLRDRLTERFLAAAFPRVPVQVWPHA